MKERDKKKSFFENAWNCIVTAYKGNGWMATLTDPAATALYSWETQKLTNWLDDIYKVSPQGAAGASGNAAGGAGAGAGNKPQGDKPMGGGKPS